MTLLAIDTSARYCAACLYDAQAQTVIAQVSEDIGRGHAERLVPLVRDLMAQAGIAMDALTRVAATVGPGSFTGIRVGVSAARAFALGLGVPAVGLTTLASLAADCVGEHAPPGPFAVVTGAGRGHVFFQSFDATGQETGPAQALAEADIKSRLPAGCAMLVGDGAFRLSDGAGQDTALGIALRIDRAVAPIAMIARLGAASVLPAEPVYVRGADATPQTGFALPRQAEGGRRA